MGKPNDRIKELLKSLTSKNIRVVLTTGRSKKNTQEWFPETEIEIFAEHGGYHRKNGEWKRRFNDCLTWKTPLLNILKFHEARIPKTLVEEKGSAIAFHYRNIDDFNHTHIKELICLLERIIKDMPLNIIHGKKVIEV